MTDLARQQARVKLIALLNELPIDADLTLGVHFLSREDFDNLPGDNETQSSKKTWTKDLVAEGVEVDLFTNEAPATPISFPFTRKLDLQLVRSEESA